MIVKTGANYQADGGYIEASRKGDTLEVRAENKTFTIPSASGVVDTRVLCKISKAENIPNGGSYGGIGGSSTGLYMGGQSLPNYPNENSIWIWFTVGTQIILPNTKTAILLEGSQDCELRPGPASTSPLLYATGPNPIAILGEDK